MIEQRREHNLSAHLQMYVHVIMQKSRSDPTEETCCNWEVWKRTSGGLSACVHLCVVLQTGGGVTLRVSERHILPAIKVESERDLCCLDNEPHLNY